LYIYIYSTFVGIFLYIYINWKWLFDSTFTYFFINFTDHIELTLVIREL